jgi:PhnB protein
MQKRSIQTTIAPWLTVRNGEEAASFYKTAFNAVETYRLETPGGLIVKLSVNGAEFWVSGSAEDAPNVQLPSGNSIRMILTVNDPDIFFARALKAGASEVFPVSEEHGWRLGRLVDPFGLHWEIGYEL